MTTLDKIEKSYDAIAAKWANAFSDEHSGKPKDREWLRWFAREIRSGGKVLDLACGPGNTSRLLADLDVDVTGVDLSQNFIREAKKRHGDIPFEQGNMLALKYADASMAGIVCFYGIVHFCADQMGKAFNEVYRILEDKGIFMCTFHLGTEQIHMTEFLGETVDVDFYMYASEFVVDKLRQSGFQQVAVVERDPYPDIEYQSRRAYVFARKASLAS
ncbi:MAG: methyltransferase domain-containing protein [Deltaproteobacteria bacterium]|nr:methyltransferase domain-containing protein [Deltaproteobacteria bacterium]